MSVGIETDDLTLVDEDYIVTVLAIAPNYQCMEKDFVVQLKNPVTLKHPCHSAVFYDNVEGITSPISAEVKPAPYSEPFSEIITNFEYDLQGLYDCGE